MHSDFRLHFPFFSLFRSRINISAHADLIHRSFFLLLCIYDIGAFAEFPI